MESLDRSSRIGGNFTGHGSAAPEVLLLCIVRAVYPNLPRPMIKIASACPDISMTVGLKPAPPGCLDSFTRVYIDRGHKATSQFRSSRSPLSISDSAKPLLVVSCRDQSGELVKETLVPTQIAFLGTGLMGRPMAENIIARGHDLTVWNRTGSKTDRLAALGAKVAETPGDAVPLAMERRFDFPEFGGDPGNAG